jgi:hypothetical protein
MVKRRCCTIDSLSNPTISYEGGKLWYGILRKKLLTT